MIIKILKMKHPVKKGNRIKTKGCTLIFQIAEFKNSGNYSNIRFLILIFIRQTFGDLVYKNQKNGHKTRDHHIFF